MNSDHLTMKTWFIIFEKKNDLADLCDKAFYAQQNDRYSKEQLRESKQVSRQRAAGYNKSLAQQRGFLAAITTRCTEESEVWGSRSD